MSDICRNCGVSGMERCLNCGGACGKWREIKVKLNGKNVYFAWETKPITVSTVMVPSCPVTKVSSGTKTYSS